MEPITAATTQTHALYRSVWERLVGARRVLLISPKSPDGDSVGSICGLGRALRAAGRDVTLYCPDPIPPQFDTIPGVHDVSCQLPATSFKQFDAIVICDASDLPFTGVADNLPTWKTPGGTLIVMDHHRTNTMFGDLNLVVQGAPSTTHVIAEMLAVNGVALDPETATCLLLGLVTDTDAFTNPAMSATAAITASRLIGAGGRIGLILRAVYDAKPLGVLRLWGKAFQRIRVHPQYDFATTVLLPEDFVGCTEDETERADGLSNFLQIVLSARAIMVLKDRGDGMVRGSLRTTRDGVDLAALAKRLGGGGHKKASGFGVLGRLVAHGDTWKVED